MNREVCSFLKLLSKSTPANKKKLIESAPKSIIDLLSKCAMNILYGHTILTKRQKEKLRPHKNVLRGLANKKISTKQKKKILQKGGFINLKDAFFNVMKFATNAGNEGLKLAGKPHAGYLEQKNLNTMWDSMLSGDAKTYALTKIRHDKMLDSGGYEATEAIRKNPEAFLDVYRERKKKGLI